MTELLSESSEEDVCEIINGKKVYNGIFTMPRKELAKMIKRPESPAPVIRDRFFGDIQPKLVPGSL